jgi:hypothetical protein
MNTPVCSNICIVFSETVFEAVQLSVQDVILEPGDVVLPDASRHISSPTTAFVVADAPGHVFLESFNLIWFDESI